MTLLITLASVAVYLGGWLLAARNRFVMTRPYTEPLRCQYGPSCQHYRRCYQRPGYLLIDTREAAAGYAALWATGWPVIFPALAAWWLLSRVIMNDDRESPAELRAKVARLEAELGISGKP